MGLGLMGGHENILHLASLQSKRSWGMWAAGVTSGVEEVGKAGSIGPRVGSS
jgi:hypothetical protein